MGEVHYYKNREPYHGNHHEGRYASDKHRAEADNQLKEHLREVVVFERRTGEVINDQWTPFDWAWQQDKEQQLCE